MQPIDAAHMVVDLTDYSEIRGAQAADIETGSVSVREMTYTGEVYRTVQYPIGIKITRRH
jgi:hypothetical protein